MATAAVAIQMSVEDYLRTAFSPDADFVDGFIEERNLGEWDHSGLQGSIYALLLAKEEEWGVYTSMELRVQVSANAVSYSRRLRHGRTQSYRAGSNPPAIALR